ncbi:MAG: EFR1 family ferrodoxin [Bacteroidaceae bacterium]|nr:EFR1 family ferrodoxin [Bacteroidaceae bacterium]
MIYYFSGTGNSKHIATHLAGLTHDVAQSITDPALQPTTDATIGLVFPVHAWSAPVIFERFVEHTLAHLVKHASPYVYMVCTCGDDIGMTFEILRKRLKTKGLQLVAGFSLIMPDSYIGLPGFDVNEAHIEKRKVDASVKLLPAIAEHINNQRHTLQLKRGPFPLTKSYVLRPIFYKWFVGPKLFKTTDACIACGKCAKACPTKNIALNNKRPEWHNNCTNCLACYHVCPKHCIVFGKYSANKGQYKLFLD